MMTCAIFTGGTDVRPDPYFGSLSLSGVFSPRLGLVFDWDEANTGHIAKHGVTRSEFEEIIRNTSSCVEEEVDEKSGELKITEIGHSNGLRIFVVVWRLRGDLLRPITAFAPEQEDIDEYLTQFYEE